MVMNKSWLGSLVDTIIGNLKLSISNIHIRYEDLESNPGHPFAAGVTLEKLSAVTIDDSGKETFVTGGALECIQKELENERGLVLKNAESITEEILHYFEKLYTNPTGESWGVEGLDWSPISEESALRLDSPFTEEEISKAIFQLDRDKAPGQMALLLPYSKSVGIISDFRPISLITSLYKIIAKVLSGRLRGVLHETIHYTQGAFVQGRQILDAVLIANEIVDERRRSGEEGVIFKIDFEKAYDHVKWDFLDHVLEKKGFIPRWRKWMSGCLSSVSYAILVNGSAKGWVKASRGLRQGDPLSLFCLLSRRCMSRMLMRAEERNMMEGFRGGRAADSEESFVSVWAHFGLKVNLNKSSIYGINLDQAHLSRLAVMLDWVGEGKRDHLVRWDVVCKPKTIGGLGLGIFLRESRSSREMVMEMVTSLSLEGYCSSLSGFSLITRYVVGNGERIRFWEDLWWGDQPLGTQYPRLFRVVVDKNISISSVLGPSRPFSWNLNFRRNLSDSEIEDLEGLMRSLDDLYLFPSNSQVPFKVKFFVWLVAHKKGISRSSFSSLFLDDWVVAQRGIVLWQVASIALIWVVWWERNARIFEDKARNSEFLWDSIVFLASLWAFCSKAFKGIPLNVIQLDWIAVCTP
ncbi:Transposon TX1 uncharacterized 149 kDa protein [Vitis vinifera]|uniref:Transposon TX1 uncharacterized 149 kDa protein n=1 Tax=Vitis vinifera TaxID=29760 RepID=A0A438DYN4_VITVI|nr:Transposon TX1 uncharacterized 149 kDa protein [Vitis vinifera]